MNKITNTISPIIPIKKENGLTTCFREVIFSITKALNEPEKITSIANKKIETNITETQTTMLALSASSLLGQTVFSFNSKKPSLKNKNMFFIKFQN